MNKYSMEMHASKAVARLHKLYFDGLISLTEYVEELKLISDAMNSYTAMNTYLGSMDDKSRRVLTGLDKE